MCKCQVISMNPEFKQKKYFSLQCFALDDVTTLTQYTLNNDLSIETSDNHNNNIKNVTIKWTQPYAETVTINL